MGGEFDSRTYEGKYTKAEIEEKFAEDCKEAQLDYGRRGYTGTIAEHIGDKIIWNDTVADNEDDALDIINEKHVDKWEPCIGIFFKSRKGNGCAVGGWCSS